MVDTVDFGEVACVGHVAGVVWGDEPGLTVLEESVRPQSAPLKGEGRRWASGPSSIKQMAANGLSPILQRSNS